MSAVNVLLGGLCLLCAASAVLAVSSRRVVHAALWLVVSLGTLAGVYLSLGAEVVGLVQLLVYVGAVVVLVLFALMLTHAPADASVSLDHARIGRALAAVVGLGIAVVVFGALWHAGPRQVPRLGRSGSAGAIGEILFTSWVFPFELISILLLAALVAAVSLSRTGALPGPAQSGTAQSGTAQPGTTQQGAAQQGAAQSKTARPESGSQSEEAR